MKEQVKELNGLIKNINDYCEKNDSIDNSLDYSEFMDFLKIVCNKFEEKKDLYEIIELVNQIKDRE